MHNTMLPYKTDNMKKVSYTEQCIGTIGLLLGYYWNYLNEVVGRLGSGMASSIV